MRHIFSKTIRGPSNPSRPPRTLRPRNSEKIPATQRKKQPNCAGKSLNWQNWSSFARWKQTTVAKITSKLAKLSKNSLNVLKWLHLYQNTDFFTGNQFFNALLSLALYFTRKRIGFQPFANVSTQSFSTFCRHI